MSGPLDGIRVVELARVLAGPYCGMVLADLGADVIKVEQPGAGDDLRHWGPPFMADGQSTYFLGVNRNKRSIALDLKTSAGREVLDQLLTRSDVLIENFRPGGLATVGLDAARLHALNPDLIHCSITAFGTVGPMRDRPGYDVLIQAMSGLMSVTGEPDGEPVRVGVALVDIAAGLYSAIGILSQVLARANGRTGRAVSTSLLEVSLAMLPNLTAGFLMAGAIPQRLGNAHPNAIPYGTYRTVDSQVVLAIGNDEQWRRLCVAMDRPDLAEDPGWATNELRIQRRAEVDAQVAAWFRDRKTADLVDVLTRNQVPNGPINDVPEALGDAQVAALGVVRTTNHPTSGPLRFVGSPLDFGADPPVRPAPLLDEHRAEILAELLEIDGLRARDLEAAGAFGRPAASGQVR
jgi:crotonobetainyl-CoA:carnitine CoA-transferase CaiB-like acyl-CoA transferase